MKILLVPSATLIPKEMRTHFGEIPTALYPLNDRPIIDHLYEQYRDKVDRFIVVSFKKSTLLKDYIKTKKLNVQLVELDELKDLGYTIFKGFEEIKKYRNVEGVYLNFADTLVFDECSNDEQNRGYFSVDIPSETWTFFRRNNKGIITNLYDKVPIPEEETAAELPLFVGCFFFKNWEEFNFYLSSALNIKEKTCDSFYAALQEFSKSKHFSFVETKKWFDVGHKENYLKAKTGVQARVFNEIDIDDSRGILRKTSRNKEKFINEIKWYLKMPNKLQYLIPRIYDYSISMENPYVSMEYYGYNTLHELFLYGELPLYKWQKIFERIRFVIDDMGKYIILDSPDTKQSMREVYIKKTISRLTVLKDNPDFSAFYNRDFFSNGKKYYSLSYYMNILPEVLEKELINNTAINFNIIHGDLCFSNILLEENHGFVRVIDPRGEFGTYDIYGDPRYEMAKLLHSLDGKYDFIIENMFELAVHDNVITFQIEKSTNQLLEVFRDVFQSHLDNYSNIRLIESTLFLSMIPLHSDYLNRQYAMLVTGIDMLDQILKEKGYE